MDMKFNVGIDIQQMYDNLGIYIESLQAQREVLGNNPNVCTHLPKFRHISEGIEGKSFTYCSLCNYIISAKGLDYVYKEPK